MTELKDNQPKTDLPSTDRPELDEDADFAAVSSSEFPADMDNEKDAKKKLGMPKLPDADTPVALDNKTGKDGFSPLAEYLKTVGLGREWETMVNGAKKDIFGDVFFDLNGGGKLAFQMMQPKKTHPPQEVISLRGRPLDMTDKGRESARIIMMAARSKGWTTLHLKGSRKAKDAMWLENYKLNQQAKLENANLPEDQQRPMVEVGNYIPKQATLDKWKEMGLMDEVAETPAPAPKPQERDEPEAGVSKFTTVQETESKRSVTYAPEDEQEAFFTRIGADLEKAKGREGTPEKREVIEKLYEALKTDKRFENDHFRKIVRKYNAGKFSEAADLSSSRTSKPTIDPAATPQTPAADSSEPKQPKASAPKAPSA